MVIFIYTLMLKIITESQMFHPYHHMMSLVIEGVDPSQPYEVKFSVEDGDNRHSYNRTEKEFQNYEIAHLDC